MSSRPEKKADGRYLQGFNFKSLIRAAVALVILIVANVFNFDKLIYILVALAALIVAGFGLILAAVKSIERKDYFSSQMLILVAAAGAFGAGCMREAILMLILGLILVTILDYIVYQEKLHTENYISDVNSDEFAILKAILSQKEAYETTLEAKLLPILDSFAKAAVLVGVLYAIFMPMIVDMTYLSSIRRGLMLILVASPVSMVASLPVSSAVGISTAAAYGAFIRDGKTLEMTGRLNTVILDKSDVVADGTPKLVSYTSPVFDNDTFLKVAAYIAFNSEQRIASAISNVYFGVVHPEVIGKFRAIPGNSMEMLVNGIPICLSTRTVLDSRRIQAPVIDETDGAVLYMTVAGKYAGAMQFSHAMNSNAKEVVEDIKNVTDAEIILFTEDSRRLTKIAADEILADEFVCECDTAKKLEAVEQVVTRADEADVIMYVTAENLDYHTSADIDGRVGYSADNADMLLAGSGLESLPYACAAAKRTKKIQRENLILAIAVKLVLIVLAFAGFATLWFVILTDTVAAILTVINTSRISDESFTSKLNDRL